MNLMPFLLVPLIAGQNSIDSVRAAELSNGARYHIKFLPTSTNVVVSLIASSEGVEDTVATQGWRHLLEHFMANGRTGNLHTKLEIKGGSLKASTGRDYTKYQITVAPEDLNLAMESLADIMMPVRTSEKAILKETKIIGYETSMWSQVRKASAFGWSSNFPTKPDPGGIVETLQIATPEDLSEIQAAHFQAANLLLIIAGPINLDTAKSSASKFLSTIPKQKIEYFPRISSTTKVPAKGFSGQAKFLRVYGLPDRRTLTLFGTAFEISSRDHDLKISYSPSNRPGLITLYSKTGASFERMNNLSLGHVQFAPNWSKFLGLNKSPSALSVADSRAVGLSWKPYFNIEMIDSIADQITLEEIQIALDELKKAPIVRGDE